MSYVRLPSIRKMQRVPQGYSICDGCQRRISAKERDEDSMPKLFMNTIHPGMMDIGLCCEPKLRDALRSVGFKFRRLPVKKTKKRGR